jgi:hypothetical protein
MDRFSLVKIVTPDPQAIERFMTEVVDIPAGWSIRGFPGADHEPHSPPSGGRDEHGDFTLRGVHAFRGDDDTGGLIVGSTESRQLQILHGPKAHIWAVAVGTRDIEGAHQRATERGIPCTALDTIPWGDARMSYFYAEVAGIVFEVMRAEPSVSSPTQP